MFKLLIIIVILGLGLMHGLFGGELVKQRVKLLKFLAMLHISGMRMEKYLKHGYLATKLL